MCKELWAGRLALERAGRDLHSFGFVAGRTAASRFSCGMLGRTGRNGGHVFNRYRDAYWIP